LLFRSLSGSKLPNHGELETLDISAGTNPMRIFNARWAALGVDVTGCERNLPHTLR